MKPSWSRWMIILMEALPESSPVEGAPSPQESYETLCRILG